MSIWCVFEEDWLKTLLCRVHTVKSKVSLMGEENILGPGMWSNEHLVRIRKRSVESKVLWGTYNINEVGPLVATNKTNW